MLAGDYEASRRRLLDLPVQIVHGGHFRSYGAARHRNIIRAWLEDHFPEIVSNEAPRRSSGHDVRKELELSLLIGLGPVEIAIGESGSKETNDVYQRAVELCGELLNSPLHFAAH
ncbi:MAG: hypothetical protein ACR2RF_21310 [Geminicoccaceae bacterium]